MLTHRGYLPVVGLFLLGALLSEHCTAKPARPAPAQPDLTPYVSIKELMQNVIDPMADNIFDAVAADVTKEKVVEKKPTTDEDWAKVEQGVIMLAEGTNLLKIPRAVAPAGDTAPPVAAELRPEQIQAKIDGDRALWNKHANELRDMALKIQVLVKARNADALFDAGGDLDRACENCHLEYWYPGDRKTVLEDQQKRVTITPPQNK